MLALHEYGAVLFSRLRWLGVAVLVLLAGRSSVKVLGAGDRKLSVKEAEQLARAALSPDAKRLPGLALEPDPKRRCVTFDALWQTQDPAAHTRSS